MDLETKMKQSRINCRNLIDQKVQHQQKELNNIVAQYIKQIEQKISQTGENITELTVELDMTDIWKYWDISRKIVDVLKQKYSNLFCVILDAKFIPGAGEFYVHRSLLKVGDLIGIKYSQGLILEKRNTYFIYKDLGDDIIKTGHANTRIFVPFMIEWGDQAADKRNDEREQHSHSSDKKCCVII